MYFIPEVAPLLDRKEYETKISFILPLLLDETKKKYGGRPINHHVTVRVFLNGALAPMELLYNFPDCKSNYNYSFTLNKQLEEKGVDPHAPGFFIIESRVDALFPLPSVLKTIGHWVSYLNEKTYVVMPSSVQFASARLDYGTSAPARLLDYFGMIRADQHMNSLIAVINPYVGEVQAELHYTGESQETLSAKMNIPPFSIYWANTAEILARHNKKTFSGNLKMYASHRIVPFIVFFDIKKETFYSADHTMQWVNRAVFK